MEIKNLFVILICSLTLFVASCAQVPKVNFRNKGVSQGQGAQNDEPSEDVSNKDERVNLETQDKSKEFRPKLALILGPGASRAFAHIGLLKEIKASNIPIHSVLGMGWASLVAAEYVDQKSVHGLEWKVSRSETLKKLSQTSFWNSKIKEKTTADADSLAAGLLTSYRAGASKRGEFTCPLLSKRKNALIFSDKRGLKNCMAVPPLFDPGKSYAPYLFDVKALRDGLVKMGAQKVIYVDVLSRNPRFFGSKEASVTGAVYWYWNFVSQMTTTSHNIFDKVIEIDAGSEILNFNTTLDSVRKGQQAGQDLVEFLKKEYQY